MKNTFESKVPGPGEVVGEHNMKEKKNSNRGLWKDANVPAEGNCHQCQGLGLGVRMRHEKPSNYCLKTPAPWVLACKWQKKDMA